MTLEKKLNEKYDDFLGSQKLIQDSFNDKFLQEIWNNTNSITAVKHAKYVKELYKEMFAQCLYHIN